ncbi:MAG TPA: hypothetical protein VEM96_14970 [Pyrinomonadaceae bacterium]|nr:hypothetical protein [Pyrinomonadaceae bacterium]
MTTLEFLWWNVQDFAHFDISQATSTRWPKSRKEYLEKLRRVEAVLGLLVDNRPPKLLALAEITEQAAHDLRDRLFPGYRVFSIASLYEQADFHIALIYDPATGFEDEGFLKVSNVPGSTRPMAFINYRFGLHLIRFYVCHWTARFAEPSEKWRQLTAQHLNNQSYEFLRSSEQAAEIRHVMIVGDLNEEPFGMVEGWLYAHRDRAASRRREHYSDKSIRRVHLYNCAWRLLGEHLAHPQTHGEREMAGSYYWRDEKTWHSFDHVIVSGSLLSEEPPYIDEANLRVASWPGVLPNEFLGTDGLPHKFEWRQGSPIGLSDHLPICGRIILE